MSDTFDLIMAAYQPTGTPQKDVDALVQAAKTVKSEGMIVVEWDACHCGAGPRGCDPGPWTGRLD